MAKKKFTAVANPLQNDVSSQPPAAEDTSMMATDRALYGAVDLPDSGRQIATPLVLDDIRPDLRQPRRAIPASVRGEWAGDPADIPGLLQHWHREAVRLTAKSLDLMLLLQGLGEPLTIESDDALLHDYLELVRLAASIHKDGLKNPISVVRRAGGYLIETGERRYIAHWLLRKFVDEKYARIPARIVERHDVWAQAAENGVRKPLNAIGMARQLALLIMDMYEGDPDIKFMSYEHLARHGAADREFYAQVANGNVFRIKRNMGERVMQVTGLKSTDQIGQYRALLDISDELWREADIHNWTEGKIRAILKPPADINEDDTVTSVTVSGGYKPTIVGLSGDESATPVPFEQRFDAEWMVGRTASFEQNGKTISGVIDAVYRADFLPRPGALMAQVIDDRGQKHEKETARLMIYSPNAPALPEAAPVLPPETDEMLAATESLGLDDAWSNGSRFVRGEPVFHITGREMLITDFIEWQGEIYARVEVEDAEGKIYGSRCKLTEIVKSFPGKGGQAAEDEEEIDLPEAQEEMLLAILQQKPMVKNAATRMALEEKGMIFVADRMNWRMNITKKGVDYLRRAGLVPDTPPVPITPPAPAAGEAAVWLSSDEERMLVEVSHGKLVNASDSTVQAVYGKLRAKGLAIMSSSAMGKIDPTSAGWMYLRQHGFITEPVDDEDDEPDEDNSHSARTADEEATPQDSFVFGGQVWAKGKRVRSKHTGREGVIRGFKQSKQTGLWLVLWDIESSANPSGKVPMESNVPDLILLDAQPAPAAAPEAEAAWDAHPLVMLGSPAALMLKWVIYGAQANQQTVVEGALKRLMEASPAEIARFVNVDGSERYAQMLEADNNTIRAFLDEVIQTVGNVCQMLYEKALEIEQSGKS